MNGMEWMDGRSGWWICSTHMPHMIPTECGLWKRTRRIRMASRGETLNIFSETLNRVQMLNAVFMAWHQGAHISANQISILKCSIALHGFRIRFIRHRHHHE